MLFMLNTNKKLIEIVLVDIHIRIRLPIFPFKLQVEEIADTWELYSITILVTVADVARTSNIVGVVMTRASGRGGDGDVATAVTGLGIIKPRETQFSLFLGVESWLRWVLKTELMRKLGIDFEWDGAAAFGIWGGRVDEFFIVCCCFAVLFHHLTFFVHAFLHAFLHDLVSFFHGWPSAVVDCATVSGSRLP